MTRDLTTVTRAGSEGVRAKAERGKSGRREAAPHEPENIRYARAKFGDVILICTKCAKRQGLPKGAVRATLKRALKERAGSSEAPVSKPRLVEVGCLGPCPKRTVAVATTASLARGRIVLVDPAGDRQTILDALLPDFGPKATLTPPGAREDSESGPRTS